MAKEMVVTDNLTKASDEAPIGGINPIMSRKDGELINLVGVDDALARKMELVNDVY